MHYSGYSEQELKPTAQLMLDYIVRTSPSLTRWATDATGDGEIENPLESSPADFEHEHPNFIKKYGAKKVSPPSARPPFARICSQADIDCSTF